MDTRDTLEDLPFWTAVGEETRMCDHCRTRKSWRTELDEDEVLSCEYIEDLKDDGCPAQAIALITGRYVEDHLCRDCTEKEPAQSDEGLGDFLREHGFQKSVDYLAITESPEQCTGPSCGNLAGFAKMVIETWGYCENHLLPAGHGVTDV